MICFGKRVNAKALWFNAHLCRNPHRWEWDWTHTCQRCRLSYLAWAIDDSAWALVPTRWRRKMLCLDCFKELT